MDPNAALTEMRAIIASCQDGRDYDADRLAELAGALDQWLSSGGFLPADWAR